MIEALRPYLAAALWFAVCGAVLYPLSLLYVRFLVVVGHFEKPWKSVGAYLLWLSFSVALLFPLVGGVVLARRYSPQLAEWPALLWLGVCYLGSAVPVYGTVCRNLPKLRAMGFFRE
jgi:hypothetical protein